MEIDVMGRTVTEATIENLQDLWDAERGLIPGDNIRRVTIDDALVDTGATLLSLTTRPFFIGLQSLPDCMSGQALPPVSAVGPSCVSDGSASRP